MSLSYCFIPEKCALKRRKVKSIKRTRSPSRRRSKPRKRSRSPPRRPTRRRRPRKPTPPPPIKKKRRRPTPPPPPPPPRRKKRRKPTIVETPPPRKRSTTKKYVRRVQEAKPQSKVSTETTHETWVCDPENGLCHLVHEDYSKSSNNKEGAYKGPLVPANDVNLLDLASGIDGDTYCAVADGLDKKWVKCGSPGAENCDCKK